jgi:glutamate racemase
MDERPIGVFDSGVGGLSVLRAIRGELPSERLIYVADSGYAPYGDRARDYIERRAVAVVEFLIDAGVKAVVVACNTATGAAVHVLRARFDIPIVAMEPAVKPAAHQTKSGVVGVLATTSTLSSAKFLDLVDRHGGGAQVLVQPCPGLVEQVEAGEFDSARTTALVEKLVRPLLARGADTLVLGCTHYPFLRPAIEAVAGPDVTVIDPASAVARELRRRLETEHLLASPDGEGHEEFWTSGPIESVSAVIGQLWSHRVRVREMPRSVS